MGEGHELRGSLWSTQFRELFGVLFIWHELLGDEASAASRKMKRGSYILYAN